MRETRLELAARVSNLSPHLGPRADRPPLRTGQIPFSLQNRACTSSFRRGPPFSLIHSARDEPALRHRSGHIRFSLSDECHASNAAAQPGGFDVSDLSREEYLFSESCLSLFPYLFSRRPRRARSKPPPGNCGSSIRRRVTFGKGGVLPIGCSVECDRRSPSAGETGSAGPARPSCWRTLYQRNQFRHVQRASPSSSTMRTSRSTTLGSRHRAASKLTSNVAGQVAEPKSDPEDFPTLSTSSWLGYTQPRRCALIDLCQIRRNQT